MREMEGGNVGCGTLGRKRGRGYLTPSRIRHTSVERQSRGDLRLWVYMGWSSALWRGQVWKGRVMYSSRR